MNNGPIKITTNGLLDTILKGLRLTGEYNKGTLAKLADVTESFKMRLNQPLVHELLVSDDKPQWGLSQKELAEINDFITEIGYEMPAAQPRDSQEWEIYLSVPKRIKEGLIALYPSFGPELITYARELSRPNSSELNALLAWVESLQKLYASAKEEPDLFHGFFLNNHNFARRACDLAKKTTVFFSSNVLDVCSECRFSSLTMNSIKLDEFFNELANYYQKRITKESKNDSYLGLVPPYISQTDIKDFIKEKFYAKSLLWRSGKSPSASLDSAPDANDSLSLRSSENCGPSPSF